MSTVKEDLADVSGTGTNRFVMLYFLSFLFC